jgi:hypothetical protein
MKRSLSFGFKTGINIAEALSEAFRQFCYTGVMEIN